MKCNTRTMAAVGAALVAILAIVGVITVVAYSGIIADVRRSSAVEQVKGLLAQTRMIALKSEAARDVHDAAASSAVPSLAHLVIRQCLYASKRALFPSSVAQSQTIPAMCL